jgi:hypothetical protein
MKNADIITIDMTVENHAELMNVMSTMENCKDANQCIEKLISWWWKNNEV